MSDTRIARLQVLAAAALFSTGGAAIKACSLDSAAVAGGRSAIAALVLAAALPGALRRIDRRVAGVAVAYAATLVLFVFANKLTTAVHAILLQSTSPLYIAGLSTWLLAEPPTRRDLASLAVIALGMGLLLSSGEAPTALAANPTLGNLLGASSGLAWALTVMGLRALSQRSPDAAASAAIVGNVLAAALTLPMAPREAPGLTDALVLGWLGVFQVGLAYYLLTRALPRVPALGAALLLFLEPVLSGVWAWLVHGELPAPLGVAGSAVILAGLAAHAAAGQETAAQDP
ncbi:MAG TPA: EamA family transporter [Myxococcota bacterium]|nr:EamA family transporter [Myxococcota bacterium]